MTFQRRMRQGLEVIGGFVRHPGQSLRLLHALPTISRALAFSENMPSAASRDPRASNTADVVSGNPLEDYFNAHAEGRGIWKWNHYFDIYQRHFHKFVGTEVHVLEIGVYSGGSLQMWKEYFGPKCRVYGVDIHPACKEFEDEHTRIFIGDQQDRAFWESVKQEVPALDVVIDDGGHTPEQQIVTLEEMLPHLRPCGVYLCEDIHGTMNVFSSYVHGLALQLNTSRTAEQERIPRTPFQSVVHSVHSYPWVTVIEKNEGAAVEFCSVQRGSQWQHRPDWE